MISEKSVTQCCFYSKINLTKTGSFCLKNLSSYLIWYSEVSIIKSTAKPPLNNCVMYFYIHLFVDLGEIGQRGKLKRVLVNQGQTLKCKSEIWHTLKDDIRTLYTLLKNKILPRDLEKNSWNRIEEYEQDFYWPC